jgi:hypothetical protein
MTERRSESRDRIEDHIVEHVEEAIGDCKAEVDRKVDAHHAMFMESYHEVKTVRAELKELRTEINGLKTDIAEILGIFKAGKGFVRVWGWIGQAVRWVSGFVIAAGAIWALIRYKGGA